MNNPKIIIVGTKNIDKEVIAKRLVEIDDSLTIIPHFTNDLEMKDNLSEFEYFIDTNTIYLAYKNNSIMTVYTTNYVSDGIMIDDFYNNDICYVTIEQFNLISDKFINENDLLHKLCVLVKKSKKTLIAVECISCNKDILLSDEKYEVLKSNADLIITLDRNLITI